ncbi:MAG: flagellar protein FlgN [Candidatus Didemnitutus sp.]|nr:flagellar protein FlgN [Candidatus Didemnitutus sp.]
MNPRWHDVAEALRQEIAGYGGLLFLFEEQQRFLFTRDADAVLRLSTEIEAQSHALHENRRERERVVTAFALAHNESPSSTLRSLLPHFINDVRPLIEALITEINVLIHRVRRVSRHNHSLLTRTLEAQQQLMRTLRPESFTQTYAPNGRVALTTSRAEPAFRIAG